MGALAWARRAGHDSIVSFDMGGTSTDVSLCPGRLLHTTRIRDSRHPSGRARDRHPHGGGRGWVTRSRRPGMRTAGGAGQRRSGPRTDQLWPRRLGSDGHRRARLAGPAAVDALLGGERRLDRDAIEPALSALAEALGGSLEETAEGVLAVADSAMERALRVISVERGYDTRDLALVAFGGAGSLHAAELAARIGAPRVLVPPHPGLLSAHGMLAAPLPGRLRALC